MLFFVFVLFWLLLVLVIMVGFVCYYCVSWGLLIIILFSVLGSGYFIFVGVGIICVGFVLVYLVVNG